jgi:hypothetical protein
MTCHGSHDRKPAEKKRAPQVRHGSLSWWILLQGYLAVEDGTSPLLPEDVPGCDPNAVRTRLHKMFSAGLIHGFRTIVPTAEGIEALRDPLPRVDVPTMAPPKKPTIPQHPPITDPAEACRVLRAYLGRAPHPRPVWLALEAIEATVAKPTETP